MVKKKPSLPYYLAIVGKKTARYLSILRALALDETPTDSPWIWTLVSDSISYNDNFCPMPTKR